MPLKNIAVKMQSGTKTVENHTDLDGICSLETDQKTFSVTASDETENYMSTTVNLFLKKAENTTVRITMLPSAKMFLERIKEEDLRYGKSDSLPAKPCDDSAFVDAHFPGGGDSLRRFIAKNLRYPEISIENGDQGRVYLSFIVETDGNLTHISIVRGISIELDQEAKRILLSSPKWIPATCNGTAFRSKYIVPLKFHLQ
jgi:hypothetical protein